MPARFPLPERLRPKSVRAKVVTLLTVPVVSLMALWGHAAVTTASQVSDTEQLKQINSALITPLSEFTGAVQSERAAALKYRAAPGEDAGRALATAKSRTDKATSALDRGLASSTTDMAALDSGLPERIERLRASAAGLDAPRKATVDDATGRSAVLRGYGSAIDRGQAVRAGLARADRTDAASDTRTVLELARAREALSRQDAVLSAAQAAGRMTGTEYRDFVGDVALQRALAEGAVSDLRPADATAYRKALDSSDANRLASAQNAVLQAGPADAAEAVSAERWQAGAAPTLAGLDRADTEATAAGADAEPYSLATLGSSGLAVFLGLLGVVISLLLSVRIGRGLVADLTGLRNSALQLASTRLPAAMRRIHNGEEIDLDAEAPLDRAAARDEIGQVGAALTTVQRAALRAVAGRAAVLTGVSGVYVSLARRSQVLLHRQLELLDTMERRTENPTDLEDLFRLDHLTTRMRRHAESLLILSGSAPGRAWRNPVPLLDAVRASIAETADIERFHLEDIPDLQLGGSAVADFIHLVAELAENATGFSPPHTPVVVRGEEVGAGAVLEIEDRGLGMGDEALTAANAKIRAADIDLLDSRQLGLFVVNRLAERQRIDVTLRRSVYGGVTAVVFLPKELLEAPQPGLRPLPEPTPARAELPARDARHARPTAAREPTTLPQRPRPATADVEPLPRRTPPTGNDAPTHIPAHARPPEPEPIAEPEPAPAPTRAPAPDDDGLPKRVRQASIAPELRTAHSDDPAGPAQAAPDTTARRSPEAARATMASLRSGRRRAYETRDESPAANEEGTR
ncbi:Nitrate and nitrite sensing [Streptomyces sp. YIM 130001]|uniref:sensor histidine kinase n=1 Tax=Streptomyces sp. YIM 130001 TaxID=2259644 RepID=UPI000E6477FE|nr:nitrate- and nitrite sensing domain-containing protein [Streptomyces sp. YIM 130001]RII14178.1 Nitrate and nitrite sensing [Streptomyces sp. YIM 130001]